MRRSGWLFGAAMTLLTAAGATAYGTKPNSEVEPIFDAPIPNIPGKSLRTVTVSYPPRGSAGAHRHAKSAYIYAYVLEGEIRSQVEGEPARIYRPGEFWTEHPGAHHVVSENASETRGAKLLAVFVVDTGDTVLTTPDRH